MEWDTTEYEINPCLSKLATEYVESLEKVSDNNHIGLLIPKDKDPVLVILFTWRDTDGDYVFETIQKYFFDGINCTVYLCLEKNGVDMFKWKETSVREIMHEEEIN